MTQHLKQALKRAADWDKAYEPKLQGPTLATPAAGTFEQRLARAITDFVGSMNFVYLHSVWFGLWIVVNAGLLVAVGLHWIAPFDPYPFGLLTMVVSLEAIFLSTFVMIAQNQQAAIADARAQADFDVNVRSEAEVAKLLFLVQTLMEHHILTSTDVGPPDLEEGKRLSASAAESGKAGD